MSKNKQNWLDWAIKLQALAQTGLAYSQSIFDSERYEEIRQIAVDMMADASGLPGEKVTELFAGESGYQTPKLDTRAAIFQGEKILLVQENNGLWSLPGGWCDVDQSVADNVRKEVREEAGLDVEVVRLAAVMDKAKNNPANSAYKVTKLFFVCRSLGGQFEENAETLQSAYFALDALPDLALPKNTAEQIALCFEANRAQHWETYFD